MNGLSLRISTGAKKSKNIMSLPPVIIPNFPAKNAGAESALGETFLQATTADEQLALLRKILDKEKDPIDLNVIRLLVVVFFHSEAKHPVKCFLTRHITKSKHLQEPFIESLILEITSHLKSKIDLVDDDAYKKYKDVISKVGMCIENFAAGTNAVKNVEETLGPYLASCLDCCVYHLRGDVIGSPSPTEKNVIYSLAHLTLRLLLHIITKNQWELNDEGHLSHAELVQKLENFTRRSIDKLLHDRDVPMDTKSVCGIVILSLETYSCIPPYQDAWKTVVDPPNGEAMSDVQVQLAMFSAVVTTVPMCRLQETLVLDGNPAAIDVIVLKFMEIVERSSLDGVLILGVARALQQLSKALCHLSPLLGLRTADRLLAFTWAHLEHYMDSVRHLTAQILTSIVQYCAHLENTEQESSALARVLAALAALGVARRGFYAGCRGAAAELGAARVLRDVAPLARLLPALRIDHVAATATATLEVLLQRHSQEAGAALIHEQWVLPILHFVQNHELDPEVLAILESLLAKAVKLDRTLVTYILPHIKEACESPDRDLKNVLVLSVARTSLADELRVDTESQKRWRGIISYDVLDEAVVNAHEEIRLQCLVLVSTGAGGPARGERALVLRFLTYNMNAQDPHFRQRAMAMLKKFMKRVFDGCRAAKRSGDDEGISTYREFIEELRQLCYSSLQPGANYSRRCTALQLLQCIEPAPLLGYQRTWKPDYVEKLLLHLDDSYETNKTMALHILEHVPLELIKDVKHSVSLQLEDIIRQAGALKPTECVSAAYKLHLLWRRLPDNILQGNPCEAKEPALFTLLTKLISAAGMRYNVLLAPRDRPTYGPLYCIAYLIDRLDPDGISDDLNWKQLLQSTIQTCGALMDGASEVVNSAAPEGIMPQDSQYSDYGNNAGVYLEDGRQVTAQMVLLCAWRTVKEATSVLGAIGARVRVPGTLGAWDLRELASTLAHVVATARHRGAFEQAYVAYERLMHRMWRDDDESVRRWARQRLEDMLAWLRGSGAWTCTADRRSAGLPFLIQALVSTEVGAGGPGTGLCDVITELLRRADAGPDADARAHACNVLRALYRDSSLDTAVRGYVGEGLRVALKGFEGATWAERNSSTLLLSALMTRVFGVSRARASLSARNRMTGRVFFLRYPQLYDIMLNKLKEASESENKQLLCPSLYPVLLLLARLYPSSLEGTESNFKLVSFVPYVVSCARSRVLYTRRLAARAAVSLVPPDRYVAHLEHLLELVSDAKAERNFCHGILLQLCALLEHRPEGVDCSALVGPVAGTMWMLAHAHGPLPCYPVLHQHVELLSMLLTSFPETLHKETMSAIEAHLTEILSKSRGTAMASGRELCLAACLRLLLALLSKRDAAADIADLVLSAVRHEVHAVCDAALDYMLALLGRGQGACDARVLAVLRARPEYTASLAAALRDTTFWRCDPQRAVKHLEILVAEEGTQGMVVEGPVPMFLPCPKGRSGNEVIYSLKCLFAEGPDHTTHLYLESLISYVSRLGESDLTCLQTATQCVRVGCYTGNSLACRVAAARGLRANAAAMLTHANTMPEHIAFQVECDVFVGLATLLQDEEVDVRAQAACTVLALMGQPSREVVPTLAASLLLEFCAGRPRAAQLLTALAMHHEPWEIVNLDTRIKDECRVFEPSEKFNDHCEMLLWTAACADRVVDLCTRGGHEPLAHVTSFMGKWNFPFLRQTMNDFDRLSRGEEGPADPRVELFVRKLKREI